MKFVFTLLGFVVGLYAQSFGGGQILISLFCGLPFTKKLEWMFPGAADYKSIRAALSRVILLWLVILAVFVAIVVIWGNGDFAFGVMVGAFWAAVGLFGKVGINGRNIIDYTNAYKRFFYSPDEFEKTIYSVFLREK